MEERLWLEPVLVTGCAGFVGMHLSDRLLDEGRRVVGVDLLTEDCNPELKRARLDRLRDRRGFTFERADVREPSAMNRILGEHEPSMLVHLAARSGVRAQDSDSRGYVRHNVTGADCVLAASRSFDLDHVVLASSSSVYGRSHDEKPTCEEAPIDAPRSVYAATKGATELLGHAHAHLGSLPVTATRLFTVYGPWGRPDMAYFIFTRALDQGEPVPLFDRGRMLRDMTFVDDAVEALARLLGSPPEAASSFGVPYRTVNVGTGRTTKIASMLKILESCLETEGDYDHRPAPAEDVPITRADTERLERLVGFVPQTPLREGLREFVNWYRQWRGSASS